MRYFFKEGAAALIAGELIEFDPEDLNHAYRVLRLRRGSTVVIADGRGSAIQGIVEAIGPEGGRVRLTGPPLPSRESPRRIVLLQGLARGEKMDQIVRQAVELGVQQITPVITGRSVPRFSRSREEGRLKRWRSLARAAAKQCRRAVLPEVTPVLEFAGALELLRGRTVVVPWEGEVERGLDRLLKRLPDEQEAVFIFIGPEGGFSEEEIAALAAAGVCPIHLGPRILRTETAAAVTAALVQAAWGDLGVSRR
ncbi:MAG: 16S rRNA (uracil(1498)-N(3))-methyltransferase [Firmicutes bacterium]|jgi:16S rRNA (uracil1498-N3)-methyltransferase|nr:16S rRNA (uracil(1498)-N(3))-methyltransferase [Bacillota bacterium]